jgi:predicted phage tail protein
MVNIFLTGKLGILFGKKWTLDVTSPAEGVRAIDINLKGKLREYLNGEGAKKYYKVAIQKKDNVLDKEEIGNPSGRGDIYIMPTIRGANSGAGKILAGIALIAVAVLAGPAGWAIAGQGAGLLGAAASGIVAGLGASLILGGVMQLLTPVPKISESSDSTQQSSNIFQGNASAISQGGAVPVVYGRALVSPMPICISLTNTDQVTSQSTDVGTVSTYYADDGSVQYSS